MTTFANMWSWKVGNFFPMRAKSLFISLQHSLSTFTLICIISPSLLSTFTRQKPSLLPLLPLAFLFFTFSSSTLQLRRRRLLPSAVSFRRQRLTYSLTSLCASALSASHLSHFTSRLRLLSHLAFASRLCPLHETTARHFASSTKPPSPSRPLISHLSFCRRRRSTTTLFTLLTTGTSYSLCFSFEYILCV